MEDYTPHINKWKENARDYRGNQAVKRLEAHAKSGNMSNEVQHIKNDKGDLEGFIGYAHDKSGQGTINEMGVAPWAQGKGHGSKLLTDAVNDMKTRGMKEVTVHADGDAGSFYRKHGFKRVQGRIHSLDLSKSDELEKMGKQYFDVELSNGEHIKVQAYDGGDAKRQAEQKIKDKDLNVDKVTFAKSIDSDIEKRFVNAAQTPEERRAKYKIAQELGHDTKAARVFRDREFPKMYRDKGLIAPTGPEKDALMATYGYVNPKPRKTTDKPRQPVYGYKVEKDIESIKEEAEPQTAKTELQKKIIGDVKYLEKKSLLNNIQSSINGLEKSDVLIQKQIKVYLKGNEMPPGDEEVMQGDKGGRYYVARGSEGGTGPQMEEKDGEQNEDEQDNTQENNPQQQIPPQPVEEKEPEIIPIKETQETRLQREGYALLKTPVESKWADKKTKEEHNTDSIKDKQTNTTDSIPRKPNKESLTKLIKDINKMIKSNDEVKTIDTFLEYYKQICTIGSELPDERLYTAYNLAKEVNIIKGFGIELKGIDNIERVIGIDSVAHQLHQLSKRSASLNKGLLYPVLDSLAEISKDLGELNRDDRLLFLTKKADNQINLLNNTTILRKSVTFDSGKSYWNLAKKAIKDGVESLEDDELVLLREWIYARI
jgi:N-acetylglutamate synthase-like GNAT family acetyltransferase